MHSGVYRDPGGWLAVGRDAERYSLLDPARYEPYPKRCVDDGGVFLGDAEIPVSELFAALLRRVAAEAGLASQSGPPTHPTQPSFAGLPSSTTGGGAIANVTLTCPADWGIRRREVLREAARSAGLGEVQMVEEPVAAATYCAEVLRQPVPLNACLLIFDFGGGTLDVTVVRREQAGWRVLSVGGLDDLGGVDVDAALVGHLGQLVAMRDPGAWRRLVDPHGTGEQRDRRAFWAEVRAAKEMLSRSASAPVQVPGSEDALHLTREELDRVAGPLVDRAVDETRRVVDRAGLPPGALAGILLVGGSSRIPLVASRLHARFGVAPTVPERPELPVALGAGLLVAPPVPAPPYAAVRPLPGPPIPGPLSGSPVGPYSGAPVGPMSGPPVSPSPMFGTPLSVPPVIGPPPAPAPVRRTASGMRRAILAGVAAVLLAAFGTGGWMAYQGIRAVGSQALGAASNGGTGTGSGSGGKSTGATGKATEVANATVPTTGARAVAIGGGKAYWANTRDADQKTDLHAVDVKTGKESWHQTLGVAPADRDLSIKLVSDLVVVDAKQSAANGGKDWRVVLDGNGTTLWQGDWSGHTDVGYVGTDAIVSVDSEPVQTERVDLRKGTVKWRHQMSTEMIISEHPANMVWTWIPSGATATNPVPGLGAQQETLGVDSGRVIELDSEDSRGAVIDANTGKQTASGTLPLDDKQWTVFDNVVVGSVNDSASAGQPQIAGFNVTDLKPAWPAVKLGAGANVGYVHPCGEHLVCVEYQTSRSVEAVFSIDTRTGKQTNWASQQQVEFGDDPYWAVYTGGLVYGDGTFPPEIVGRNIGLTVVNPTDGTVVRTLDNGATLVGGSGKYALLSTTSLGASDKLEWGLAVWDVTTGAHFPAFDVGVNDEGIGPAAVSGTSFATIGADNKFHLVTGA
jgi:hypothetical protein